MQFTNVYDFGATPNVNGWLTRMSEPDGHDTVHAVLSELGDISQQAPSMEAIKSANKNALKALQEKLDEIGGNA